MAMKTVCCSFTKVEITIGYHIHLLEVMVMTSMTLVSLNG